MKSQRIANEKGEKVYGRSLHFVAKLFAPSMEWSIAEAERIKGSPPNYPEIICVFEHFYTRSVIVGYVAAIVIVNLFREDRFYADEHFERWSMKGPDGTEARKSLEKFSEKFARLYPGY